jgi:deoxyribodipyrimidine photo-lyase
LNDVGKTKSAGHILQHLRCPSRTTKLPSMVYVVWFKKDLRWHDHAPLANAALWAEAGAANGDTVLPLWVYEPAMWQQSDMAVQHLGFANECLGELSDWVRHDAHITSAGSQPGLCRLHGDMLPVLAALFAHIGHFTLVSHEETGNSWSYQRDLDVATWCKANGVEWREFASNGVVRRLQAQGGRNRWGAHHKHRMESPLLTAPSGVHWVGAAALQGLPLCGELGAAELGMEGSDLQSRKRGGRSQALLELLSFLERRGQYYRFEMSSPVTAPESCSRISAHLAWGTLNVRECIKAVATQRSRLSHMPASERPDGFLQSLKSFEGRLHWHCHFIQKLESEPAIEHRNVNRGFDNLRNEGELTPDEQTRLMAWRSGRTGYPFVDACMRSLLATGWINFRMRAMLMSFGAYQLWLHWRHTGLHLARQFTDFEPGIHWSQCQMQSGVTGINTIRMYCPVKQSHDQDPTGAFIRQWVSELAGVAPEFIHEPWLMDVPPPDYPAPIVELKSATLAAKEKIYGKKAEAAVRSEAKKVFEKHGSRSPNRARMEAGGQRSSGNSAKRPPKKPLTGPADVYQGGQQLGLEF